MDYIIQSVFSFVSDFGINIMCFLKDDMRLFVKCKLKNLHECHKLLYVIDTIY